MGSRRPAVSKLQGFATARLGQPVSSLSGEYLGSVSEVADGYFLVHGGAGDLWLAADSVFTSDSSGITLICQCDGMSRYASPEEAVRLAAWTEAMRKADTAVR